MKKFIFLPLMVCSFLSFGQARFVVQNGTAKVFSNINQAISAANAGDTLYIPGGGFAIANTTINKTLHWIGVGHYPDSTAATGQSRITSPLTFDGNCDNSSFEGIYFTSTLSFGSVNNDAQNISMKKCRVGGSLTMRAYQTDTLDINFYITESVLAAIDARYGSNCLMEKSLVFGTIHHYYQSFFDFNIFSTSSTYMFYRCNSCLFKNNIIAYSQGFNGTESCEFSYNIFQSNLPYDPVASTFTGGNNITNVGWDKIFSSINGNIYAFDYKNDYHLNAASTGKDAGGNTVSIIGAAEDGTNMGIYGSALPYKDGAVPFYPHVRNLQIDKSATAGQLGVKITVAAQER
jgi:hypothetical protein